MKIKTGLIKMMNVVMNRLLRSPLHKIMSGHVMAIEYKGHKSGQIYSMPAAYFINDGYIYCFIDGDWWRNFLMGQNVNLLIHRNKIAAFAQAMKDDKDEFIRVFGLKLEAHPGEARFYKIGFDENKKPKQADLERLSEVSVMVKFMPDDKLGLNTERISEG